MLLASALVALAAPQTAATIDQKEMLCVFDELDDATLETLAEMVLRDDPEAGPAIVETARPAVDKCASTWKWTGRGRVAGALTAAAFAGMMVHDDALEHRLSKEQLAALLGKMRAQDRYYLTFDGGQKFPAAEGKAFTERFEALAKREGIKPADYPNVAFYLKAGARFLEMQDAWSQIAATGKR